MAAKRIEKIVLEGEAAYNKKAAEMRSRCRLWKEKVFQGTLGHYETETQKVAREVEAKQHVHYLSMADIVDVSRMEQRGSLKLRASAERDGRLESMLEECLSYLPYLEQMAQTYGKIYWNPREASREMAPFMNRDLKALGR